MTTAKSEWKPAEVAGLFTPKKVYRTICSQTILNRWAMDCGKCERPFVSWGWFQRARCPWCQAVNYAGFTTYY